MQLPFLKMHGAGNRILVIDQREQSTSLPTPEQLVKLGNEATGPGFDQLMWLLPADSADSVASYRVFNSDGSEALQCGNGLRCVAWVLSQESDGRRNLRLASPAGPVEARIVGDRRVSVSMGAPVFEPARIPFVADSRADRYEIQLADRTVLAAVLSMGNPHCVLQVDAVAAADVADLGPQLEHHARFPERCNVGFMAVRERDEIDLRVFERGAGETLACGTGACAAVVAAQQQSLVDEEVRVNLPGGQLMVSWRGGADTVWLTGNVELTSEGTIDL